MKLLLPSSLSFLALCGIACGQGPLAPPAAPAPTQKSLQQIEPRIDLQAAIPAPGVTSDATHHYLISQPGSYYLSADLTLTKTIGIKIDAANVTLDLNGFTILCGAGTSALSGIEITTISSGCQITNGKIDGSGSTTFNGVACDSPAASPATEGVLRDVTAAHCLTGMILGGSWRLDGCRVSHNSKDGISDYGPLTAINCELNNNGDPATATGSGLNSTDACNLTHCIANANADNGFYVKSGVFTDCSTLGDNTGIYTTADMVSSNCVASKSGNIGFYCLGNANFSNCQAADNADIGFYSLGQGAYSNCQAANNKTSGFICITTASMTNCTAVANKNFGFHIGDAGSLNNCSATSNGLTGNQAGFYSGMHCTFTGCCSIENYGNGFEVSQSCSLIGCNASSNGQTSGSTAAGIKGTAYNTVRNCTVIDNNADGILVSNDCALVENTVSGNCRGAIATTAGIHLTGSDNDVEGNAVNRNTIDGMNVEAVRNLIVRNAARSNGQNYIIVANNRVASIIVPAQNAAAIAGGNNGDGGGFTNIDPWANLSY